MCHRHLTRYLIIGVALSVLLSGSVLQASVLLFSNFEPDPLGFYPTAGYALSQNGPWMGASFSTSEAATLDYANVVLFATGPNDPAVSVSVYSDNNGLPGNDSRTSV